MVLVALRKITAFSSLGIIGQVPCCKLVPSRKGDRIIPSHPGQLNRGVGTPVGASTSTAKGAEQSSGGLSLAGQCTAVLQADLWVISHEGIKLMGLFTM